MCFSRVCTPILASWKLGFVLAPSSTFMLRICGMQGALLCCSVYCHTCFIVVFIAIMISILFSIAYPLNYVFIASCVNASMFF